MSCVEGAKVGSHYVVCGGGEGRFTLCSVWRGGR